MTKLILVAHIYAKEDAIDHVKNELEKLIPPTKEEEGCLQYDLHLDLEDPSHFMFYEIWESRDHLQQHMNSEHIKNYKAANENTIEKLSLYEMAAIG